MEMINDTELTQDDLPPYTLLYHRGRIWRGDTLQEFAITLTHEESGEVIRPVKVKAQIRTKRGQILWVHEPKYEADGRIIIPRINGYTTSRFPVGVHIFDVEYLLEDGTTCTFLRGNLIVKEDVSQ